MRFSTHSKTRADTPEQQWWLTDGATKIQAANTTLCLDGGEQGEFYLNAGNNHIEEQKGKERKRKERSYEDDMYD